MVRFLVLLICLIALPTCTVKEEPVNIRLTMAERERLDKMITAKMDSLRPALEAYCDSTFAERVLLATDSIVQVRLEEEARLRARIPENLRHGR